MALSRKNARSTLGPAQSSGLSGSGELSGPTLPNSVMQDLMNQSGIPGPTSVFDDAESFDIGDGSKFGTSVNSNQGRTPTSDRRSSPVSRNG